MANIPPPPPEEQLFQSSGNIPPPPPEESLYKPTSQESPKFYELEKQRGLPKGPGELVKQFGRQLGEQFISPIPGSVISMPVGLPLKALQEQSQQLGTEASKFLINKGVGVVPARIAGAATTIATDPMTIEGGISGAKKVLSSAKLGFNSAKNFIKGMFTKPATEEELTALTIDLGTTLSKARQQVGAKLGEMRGTNEAALDRLGNIAKKGTNPETTPQEAAQMYDEYFKSRAPLMEEAGMTAPEGIKPAPKVEVYVKGMQKDGKGGSFPIYNVKGAPEEISKLGFGPDPGSIPDTVLKQHGLLPDVSVKGPTFASPQEEIKHLIKMRASMKDQISKRVMDQQGNMVKAVSSEDERAFSAGISKINAQIERLPGGKAIRDQEKKFSELADLYDDFQKKLQNPNEAREFLKGLFLNPKGKKLDLLNKLQKLEQLAGTNIVSDLREAFNSTKGLTYEQLKHPVASAVKGAFPYIGGVTKAILKSPATLRPLAMKGLQHPFDNENMRALRERLNAK